MRRWIPVLVAAALVATFAFAGGLGSGGLSNPGPGGASSITGQTIAPSLVITPAIDAGHIVTATLAASGAVTGLTANFPGGYTYLSGQNALSDGSAYWIATSAGGWVLNAPTRFSRAENAGQKTLSAGTATQTVVSGMHCVCTDETAPGNLTGCSVTTTTLTITASGATDVVNYHCF